MNIQINGARQIVPDRLSVSGLITHLKLTQRKLAVEVNREIIPPNRHACTLLSDNDVVEIIHAVGGG